MKPLTPREMDVLVLLCECHANKEIAHRMGLTRGTVQIHLTRIFRKTGTHSRMELFRYALKSGLVTL